MIKKTIDHIVYTVSDLDRATIEFEKMTGVRPIFGGYHPSQGTKNALINLDNGAYLELLAKDDSNTNVKPPRWMGVDFLTKDQITRFALKSNTLKKDARFLQKFDAQMGQISGGSRSTTSGSLLQWELLMPLAAPEVELAPFIIDWSNSEIHPNTFLPEMGCKLIEIYATHPTPHKFDKLLESLDFTFRIDQADTITLKSILETPNGILTI